MLLGLLFTPILSNALVHPLTWLSGKLTFSASATTTSSSEAISTGSSAVCGSTDGIGHRDKLAKKFPYGDDLDCKALSTTSAISQWARAAAVYASLAVVVLVLAPSWLLLVVGLPSHPLIW